jgi:hypothetical protein
MMDLTDRDFRRASWQYRAREQGFKTVEQQRKLIEDPTLAGKKAAIARRTRKDAVDFDSLTPAEKHLVEVIFFYPWMSRASVWTARTVLNRPAKSAAMVKLAQQGQVSSGKELGDQPEWMKGYIKTPWGVVNPKSVLAPTTVGDEIVQGRHVVRGALGLEKGNVKSAFQEFGTPPLEVLSGGVTIPQLAQTQLPVSTYVRAGQPFGKLPGGFAPAKTFPKTGLWPALGPVLGGGLAPRHAVGTVYHEQAKRDRMLQTTPMQHIGMRIDEAMKNIPNEVKVLQKHGGISPQIVAQYKGDLDAIKHRDEFRLKFAQGKGKTSYRALKPADKVEAALQYLEKYSHLPHSEVQGYRSSVKGAGGQQLSSFANSLWSTTGIGQTKTAWTQMVKAAKATR